MFSAQLGIGPGQYLNALRVARAKELLLADDDPVIDVACEVGFDSLSSFGRRFRSTVGVTPGRLRRLAQTLADRPPRPFTMLRPHPLGGRAFRVLLELPEGADQRGDPSIWVGWYPQPAPIGLPASGVLASGVGWAVAAGGVVPADDIGKSGRVAVARDVVGAGIGMWQPRELEGYECTGAPGSPVWCELMTHRCDDASAIYISVFDAELAPMAEEMDGEGNGFRYAMNGPGRECELGTVRCGREDA